MNIENIVLQLVASNAEAARIINKMSVSSDDTDIEKLKQINRNQRIQLAALEADIADEELTDEQQNTLVTTLEYSMSSLNYTQLTTFYSKSSISKYSRIVRYLVALAGSNVCTKKKYPVPALYLTLISTQGATV